ncbi:MAG: oligopeptide/dipeptide ABC transporter ATP-binding protein, partial [Promethearchaeota archaeon]
RVTSPIHSIGSPARHETWRRQQGPLLDVIDRIAVMYLGKFVETGSVDQIFSNTSHPYAKALLSARSTIDPERKRKKLILRGEVPSSIRPPPGCYFNPRCSSDARTPECSIEEPHEIVIEEGHSIWCVNPPK